MKKTVLLDQAMTTDGKLMTLYEHDGALTIRIDGVELMSTRQHHSEEMLAEYACGHLGKDVAAKVLIGGLGLGFTLRATLGQLGPQATVVVAELMPAVIRWNLTPTYNLAADALADPRVTIVAGDVTDSLRRSRRAFDAVLLDIDNGASGLSTASNRWLYTDSGLATARGALRPGGCLAVWSATDAPTFIERMRGCGFTVTVEKSRAHRGGGGWNYVFCGRLHEPRPGSAEHVVGRR